jgi:PAS domain S-box-containing protein
LIIDKHPFLKTNVNRQRFLRDALATVLFGACFSASYAFSYALLGFNKSVAPLWPATGVLLAALLLSPPKRWWYWYVVGVTASTVHASLFVPAPASVHLFTTFIGATQVLVQAWLIGRWLGRPLRFERLQDVLVLVVVVAAVNFVTTPFAAVAVSSIRSDNLLAYMRARWLNHTLTALALTPFLVTWAAALGDRSVWRWRRLLPWLALLAGTLAIAWLAILPGGSLEPFLPAPYLCLLPLATAAILFRARGATLITFVVMLYVMIAVSRGGTWPEGDDIVHRLARAQVFLSVISITGLLLGTSMAEIDARARLLRESEERYRTAMHNSAIGMGLVSLQGRWLEVNPKLCQITGYSQEEMLQKDFDSLIYRGDGGPAGERTQDLITGAATSLEIFRRFEHKSGQLVWVHVTSTLVRDGSGQPLHFVTQTQDITARKEAEAKLFAAAERLALALRTSRLGVWRHNLTAGMSEWDARMFDIFGVPPTTETVAEARILQAVAAEDRLRLEQSWREISSESDDYRITCQVRWPDGQLRHVELQGIVELDAAGRPEWVIGVANDTTEIVRATAESVSLKAQLQQAQKMEALGNLAAGVAHDFNTLLNGINVFVEMASTTLAPSHEASSLLTQAQRGAGSARALVRRILNYSRGTKLAATATCNVVELVRDTAPLLAAALPPNVSLSLDMQCDEARVRADPAQLQQILINLSLNAAHAIDGKPGKVDIRVGLGPRADVNGSAPAGPAKESHVLISVTDDGSGMDEHTRAHIFDPYFTTKKEGDGTGLGLVIVRDIVAAHSGQLEVESSVGKGTTISVRLPVNPPAAAETDPCTN